MESNDRAGISILQPTDHQGRVDVAKKCCSALELPMPLLVDDQDDSVGHAYSGMPDRLYVLDREGRVAYKSGRGPFGFKPGEMEQSLVMLLLDQAAQRSPGRVPVLDDQQAWQRLPEAEVGSGRPLPIWARALAGALPRTTAAMLELDYVQRAQCPLDPKLRTEMRWVAAHANRCAYTEAYALADMHRTGVSEERIRALAGDPADFPEADRRALEFARKMTQDASKVTDEEVAQLTRIFGEKQLVAMVHLLAYANFQDRLLLTLDLPVEPDGPLPPFEVRFAKSPVTAADRPSPPGIAQIPGTVRTDDEEWLALDYATLQKNMEGQRARPTRITVPSWEEVRKVLPPGSNPNKPSRVRWSLVSMGNQPEMTGAWFSCLRTFAQEAKQDRVFEESLFWVITRTLSCFY
jgi:alkylhydroperoxidase family enzyme